MNIELKLDAPLVDFTGDEIKDATLAKSLASLLGTESSKDESKIHKLVSWASALYSNGCITVDEGDLKFIKELVIASERFSPVVKSPILLALDDAKDAARIAKDKKSEKK